MYPLYVKALDWKTPLIVNVEATGNAKPVRPDTIQQIAGDFPDVYFVIAQARWPSEKISRLADDAPNTYYCFDTDSLFDGNALEFANSPTGRSRCMWGSNGKAWEEALAGIAKAKLDDREGFLHGNATRLFGLKQHRKRKVKRYHEMEEVLLRIVAE
jgi:predicted TIM-barrel fold metal-dependent hydrolase